MRFETASGLLTTIVWLLKDLGWCSRVLPLAVALGFGAALMQVRNFWNELRSKEVFERIMKSVAVLRTLFHFSNITYLFIDCPLPPFFFLIIYFTYL